MGFIKGRRGFGLRQLCHEFQCSQRSELLAGSKHMPPMTDLEPECSTNTTTSVTLDGGLFELSPKPMQESGSVRRFPFRPSVGTWLVTLPERTSSVSASDTGRICTLKEEDEW